ncbi:hypothetical protein ACFLIM_39345 [Nonomuraea sp. M3C6]|uniref:DUF2637 domain-containing protein n=1 Tax=Nonomuraea marmarensis TaxID=3351344 RepID=A0ABW7APD6_9ACTN
MNPSTLFDYAADVFGYATDNPISSAVIVAVALAVLVLAFLGGRALIRIARHWWTTRPTEDAMTIVAASIATGVSAQGMWRFSGDVLGFDGPLRFLLFAFIEVAMVTSAVRARRNMRENHKAGVDGLAVWALTGLSAVLSAMDSASFPEAVFRLAAPLVAAWLWERGMSIERQRLTGRTRINWRLTPERVLVRVGLAESSDRTATEVDTHRRLTRVALTAKRARALREAGASARKQRRALAQLDKAMDRAVEHTGLVQDKAKQEQMLAQIGALYNTAQLTELRPRSFWQQLADDTAAREERDRVAADAMAELRDFSRGRILPPPDASAIAHLNGAAPIDSGSDTAGGTPRDTAGGTPRDTAGGTPGGTAPAVPSPPATRPRPTVSRAPKDVPRKPNGSRHGTPAQPSSEELERRIEWLHDLAKTNPGMDVTDLRDKAIEEYGVSRRTAYRYIEQAGLAPRGTADGTDGGTPDGTAGAASDTPGDTPGDTASGAAPNAA